MDGKEGIIIGDVAIGFSGSGVFPISDRVRQIATSIVRSEPKVEVVNESFIKNVIEEEKFNEQRLYDIFNIMANVRYEKPKFRKCKSCGYLVVEYQLDKDDICEDCGKAVE